MTDKVARQIIRIDEEKCDGCGLCVPACQEGALAIVDGKARLVSEVYCDGLGACLGECPRGAITIEEREAATFDEQAVQQHLAAQGKPTADARAQQDRQGAQQGHPCPSAMSLTFEPCAHKESEAAADASSEPSALSHWPVQLMLVPANAPYLQGAELLVVADCVPFAYAGFHRDLLPGRAVAVACPKLDDVAFHQQKLTQILRESDVRKVVVVHMEVPCCFGLVKIARQALEASGKDIPFEEITITVRGEALPTAAESGPIAAGGPGSSSA